MAVLHKGPSNAAAWPWATSHPRASRCYVQHGTNASHFRPNKLLSSAPPPSSPPPKKSGRKETERGSAAVPRKIRPAFVRHLAIAHAAAVLAFRSRSMATPPSCSSPRSSRWGREGERQREQRPSHWCHSVCSTTALDQVQIRATKEMRPQQQRSLFRALVPL